jgi:hypothetical protein
MTLVRTMPGGSIKCSLTLGPESTSHDISGVSFRLISFRAVEMKMVVTVSFRLSMRLNYLLAGEHNLLRSLAIDFAYSLLFAAPTYIP